MRRPRVVLVTGHYWNSRRRAGFHWLADAFHSLGWEVLFFTSTLSWLSLLRRDYRLRYPDLWRQRNRLYLAKPSFYSYVWFAPFHPANLRFAFLNSISKQWFASYGELPLGEVEEWISNVDLFVFDSTPGLLLFRKFKRLNPRARFVYRVSDVLRLLKPHIVVLDFEDDALSQFDLVSVPSEYMYGYFKTKAKNLKLHHHGIHKDFYDRDCANPFENISGTNAVFVGVSHFDYDFLLRASSIFSDWNFHIVGPIKKKFVRSNVYFYGEKKFEETIPYIKHADVGLANWVYSPGAESFSDSLKIIQYTYVRLPIVAPDFLCSSRPNVISYRPGDDASIAEALRRALEIDRSTISTSDITSWEELAQVLVNS